MKPLSPNGSQRYTILRRRNMNWKFNMHWKFSAVMASAMFVSGAVDLITGQFATASASFSGAAGWGFLYLEERKHGRRDAPSSARVGGKKC